MPKWGGVGVESGCIFEYVLIIIMKECNNVIISGIFIYA